MKVAVIGGTGAMGSALARRLSERNEVMIGSRDPTKARAAAERIAGAGGGGNSDASLWCEAAVVTIPFSGVGKISELSAPLMGKLVISAVNPLTRSGGFFQYALKEGSAAELLAEQLPKSHVATGFNNVPVSLVGKTSQEAVDILVAADSRETFEKAATLVRTIDGMRPLYVGPLAQAESVERATALVLNASLETKGPKMALKFVP